MADLRRHYGLPVVTSLLPTNPDATYHWLTHRNTRVMARFGTTPSGAHVWWLCGEVYPISPESMARRGFSYGQIVATPEMVERVVGDF